MIETITIVTTPRASRPSTHPCPAPARRTRAMRGVLSGEAGAFGAVATAIR
jgi:hypothetical protein